MMPGIWQMVIVLVIVLVLFGGRGKISGLMGDIGKGLKSFKKNIKDENSAPEVAEDTKQLSEKSDTAETVDVKDKSTQG